MVHRLFLMAMRGASLVSKFALTIFIAKLLNLNALGFFGLIGGLTTMVPALLGLGMNGPTFRGIVNIPLERATQIASTRLAITVLLNTLVQPVIFFVFLRTGLAPSPLAACLLVMVVTFEHISSDLHGIIIARNKIGLANMLLFIRAGVWPIIYMCLALYFPELRTIVSILFAWIVGIFASWLFFLFALVSARAKWKLALDYEWARAALRGAGPFYLFDIGAAGSQYVDRFILTSMLGLSATGIYTFFWTVANAMGSLITFGVSQPYSPRLIGLAKDGDRPNFINATRAMQSETLKWCAGIGLPLLASLPFLLPFLHKPELLGHELLFGGILVATTLRARADALHTVLYAQHQDNTMAIISIFTIVFSVLMNLSAVKMFGLYGSMIAMVMTSLLLLYMRHHFTRKYLRES